jgi:hypothetical protein
MIGQVERELDAIKRGINFVIPIYRLKQYLVDSIDFEFLIGGCNDEIDLKDWRANTGLL